MDLVNKELIRRLASLAQLELDEPAVEEMEKALQKILALCQRLDEVNTDGVAPLYFLTERDEVWREDIPAPPLPRAQALKNAPDTDGDYFRVPKTIIKK